MKNTLLKVALLVITLYALILGAWSVMHGDLNFHTDIARDFLLMQEISDKKIVFIGPRADWKGLFHGPLWLYVNYPAYVLGNGNPVTVGWYWVAMTVFFAICYYFIAKSLFNKLVGYLYSTLFIVTMIPYMNTFYNPTGALFMAPFYFYFAVKFFETKQIKYMLLHLFFAGLVAQFQLAVGGPFVILSLLWLAYEAYKAKSPKLLSSALILAIPLSSFIIFNIRHNFSYLTAVIEHFSGVHPIENITFLQKLSNRIDVMLASGLGFFRDGNLNAVHVVIGYFMAIMLYSILKNPKAQKKYIYILFMYFYGGFYLLSFVHNTYVMPHYSLTLIALPILIFTSMQMYANKKVFTAFYIGIIFLSLFVNTIQAANSYKFRGVSKDSWKFMNDMFTTVYNKSKDKEFAVYIYTPDIYAYTPKHAFTFMKAMHPDKNIVYQEKKHETFLLYEPYPSDRPELDGSYWRNEEVKIKSAPKETINFPNGYRLERYELTAEDLAEPSITLIDDWVSQR